MKTILDWLFLQVCHIYSLYRYVSLIEALKRKESYGRVNYKMADAKAKLLRDLMQKEKEKRKAQQLKAGVQTKTSHCTRTAPNVKKPRTIPSTASTKGPLIKSPVAKQIKTKSTVPNVGPSLAIQTKKQAVISDNVLKTTNDTIKATVNTPKKALKSIQVPMPDDFFDGSEERRESEIDTELDDFEKMIEETEAKALEENVLTYQVEEDRELNRAEEIEAIESSKYATRLISITQRALMSSASSSNGKQLHSSTTRTFPSSSAGSQEEEDENYDTVVGAELVLNKMVEKKRKRKDIEQHRIQRAASTPLSMDPADW